MKYFFIIASLIFFIVQSVHAKKWIAGRGCTIATIKGALSIAHDGDTILVKSGIYKEGNILINKAVYMIGENMPVLDGQLKYEVVSIKSSHVTLDGFKIQNAGYSTINEYGGVKIYDSKYVTVKNNSIINCFFGVYIQYGKHCIVKYNSVSYTGKEEQFIGNGIHCWKSDSLQIIANHIQGQRDGIYFEFVTHSLIWRNYSISNNRYGLHFMFSNNDAYICNVFDGNGAGVAVMFTKYVVMYNNVFKNSIGDASYGILLKEISDAEIIGNKFLSNTSSLFLEGANRILISKNEFIGNGWGLKIQANCMDNTITENNFKSNTFDISTNGFLVLNKFDKNYWDKYQGYNINKDLYGDVPYHPLSIYGVIIENNPNAMLLYRSFMVSLMERTEKLIPSLTPDNFQDLFPMMKPYNL